MKSACFTGHRNLNCDLEDLKSRLYNVLERAIVNAKITEFYNGGAIGWDMLTAQTVLQLREKYPHIRLNMILPCSPESQSYKWTSEQKKAYFSILKQADSIEQIADHYFDGCMKQRNARLVELSDCCFCYWNGNLKSGTSQTIRMVKRKHILIVNFYHNFDSSGVKVRQQEPKSSNLLVFGFSQNNQFNEMKFFLRCYIIEILYFSFFYYKRFF